MSASPGVALPPVPRVSGMQRPGSWGHRFGAQLRCDWCRASWLGHQDHPQPCPVRREVPRPRLGEPLGPFARVEAPPASGAAKLTPPRSLS